MRLSGEEETSISKSLMQKVSILEYLESIGIDKTRGILKMNLDAITIEDCLEMFEKKNKETVINDGEVKGFE